MSVVATSTTRGAGPVPETAKRGDIQGLRALAVLLVVLYHAEIPFVPAGFAGVDVFFVISGFVITAQILRQHDAGRFGFAQFYARRVKRLWPAMTATVLTVLALSFLLLSPMGPQSMVSETAVGAMLAAGNIAIVRSTGGYFDAAATTNPLLHVWSLAVEEQFYLLFPAILVLCLAFRHRRGLVATALTLITVASLALSLALSGSDRVRFGKYASDLAFYSSPTRAWEFGVGALVALWASSRTMGDAREDEISLSRSGVRGRLGPRFTRPGTVSTVLGLAGLGVLVGMNGWITDDTVWPGWASLVPVLATGALIVAGTLGTGVVQRFLSTRVLVRLGDLSYSVYLWHWPAIVFAKVLWPYAQWAPALAAVASLLPAYLCYRLVEQPLRFTGFRSRQVLGAGLVTSAATVVLALTVSVMGPGLIPGATQYAADQKTTTYGREHGCMIQGTSFTEADVARCTVSTDGEKGTVMLVGDSHADMLSNGVIEAAAQLGYGTTALTASGCDFSRTADPSQEGNDCAGLASMLLDRAVSGTSDKPALVVMSHWIYQRLTRDADWLESLRPAITELRDAGIPVVFALDAPAFAEKDEAQSSACKGGWLTMTCSKSLTEIDSYEGTARADEEEFVASLPGVTVFDPWSTFCDAEQCSALVDGRLAYYDYNHLNGLGSVALDEPLRAAFRTALAL